MEGRNQGQASPESLLASQLSQRLAQLGLSRREFVKRTGMSRQTLYKIEHEGFTRLAPASLRALDKGLFWKPGTCLSLIQGDASVMKDADESDASDREGAIRWKIVERIHSLSLDRLERLIAMMEGEGITGEDDPPEDVLITIEARLARVESQLAGGRQ